MMTKTILRRPDGKTLISVTVAFVVIGFLVLLSRPKPQPEIECYIGQTQKMTVQEVANLLGIPLVELTWFPNNLNISPVITTTPSYSYHPHCRVEIDYPKPNSTQFDYVVSLYIDQLGSIQLTKAPTSCSYHFDPNGPINTDCSIEVDGSESTLRISFRLSSGVNPEDALKILDGIRVVEPQE
jgi:hypothetical protein